jgi:hypothetical protein
MKSGGLRTIQTTRPDATALTIVEVDLMTVSDPLIKAPTYKLSGE